MRKLFSHLYQKRLKSWNLARRLRKFFFLERATIVRVQGASEDKKFAAEPTRPNSNFLSIFGIVSAAAFQAFFFSAYAGEFTVSEPQKHLFSSSVKEALKSSSISKSRRLLYWTENVQKAKKIAQETDRALLLAFVGSKWCPWSQKLEEEVLTHQDFIKSLKEDFILVWLDFPESTLFSTTVKEENWQLKETYNIQELPTLLLINQEGEVISHFGYIPLDAQSLANTIKEVYGDYEQIKQVLEGAEFATLSSERVQELYLKAKKLDCKRYQEKLLEAGVFKGKGSYFLLEKYASLLEKGKKQEGETVELRKKIADLDPKNAQGTHLQLALLDFQKNSTLSAKKSHTKLAIAPLLDYIQQFGKTDHKNLWRVEMMIAQHLFSKGYSSRALKHAQASYDSAPEEAKAEIAQSLEYLKAQQTSKEEIVR